MMVGEPFEQAVPDERLRFPVTVRPLPAGMEAPRLSLHDLLPGQHARELIIWDESVVLGDESLFDLIAGGQRDQKPAP